MGCVMTGSFTAARMMFQCGPSRSFRNYSRRRTVRGSVATICPGLTMAACLYSAGFGGRCFLFFLQECGDHRPQGWLVDLSHARQRKLIEDLDALGAFEFGKAFAHQKRSEFLDV